MSKTKQLNELFAKWKAENYEGEQFLKDGIVNEDLYQLSKKKILFIAKESNDQTKKDWDYREWWNEVLKYSFSYRIAEWSYGILNDFPIYDKIWEQDGAAHNAIKHIAFMNVKKSGGFGSADYDEILEHIKNNIKFLHEQIDIIDPDLIILGVSYDEYINELFLDLEWKKSGYGIDVARYNNAKIIRFHHPSARIPAAASYSLLGNVINSEVYQKL